MSWLFVQSSGAMLDPDRRLAGIGYSGAGPGKNAPKMEAVHDVGPIPRGEYTMGEPVNSHVHGPYAIPLHPDVENDMHGRDAFLCHGDSLVDPGNASEGCIVIARDVRVRLWESTDHRLEVVSELSLSA